MRQLMGEILQLAGLVVSLAALATGLILIHPGLALATAGLAGLALWYAWQSRDRPVPQIQAGTEQRDPYEIDPDDDGRMEVRPL